MGVSIGLEASKASFAFVVLRGSPSEFEVLEHATRAVPPHLTRASELSWIAQELEELIHRLHPDRAVVRRAEVGRNASNALLEHAEVDAALLIAADRADLRIEKMPSATIARTLGYTTRSVAPYLDEVSARARVPKLRRRALAAALAGLTT
jgi:hypothetical protein